MQGVSRQVSRGLRLRPIADRDDGQNNASGAVLTMYASAAHAASTISAARIQRVRPIRAPVGDALGFTPDTMARTSGWRRIHTYHAIASTCAPSRIAMTSEFRWCTRVQRLLAACEIQP